MKEKKMKRKETETTSEVSVSTSFLTSGDISAHVMNVDNQRLQTKEDRILYLLSKIANDISLIKNKMEEKK